MFYIVNAETGQIIETWDIIGTPDVQDLADSFGCAVYIIRGEHSGLSAEPCVESNDETR